MPLAALKWSETGKIPTVVPFGLAPNRGLPSQRLSTLLVRSYRTFAPLPPDTSEGGIFLWHYPHDRSHWALPSKFGLWGARTFLKLVFTLICNCRRLLFLHIQCNRSCSHSGFRF